MFSVPYKVPTISWRASVALVIYTAVLSHGTVSTVTKEECGIVKTYIHAIHMFGCIYYTRKCYMGFCTVMDLK